MAIVDDEDHERVSQFNWHAFVGASGYVAAQRSDYAGGKKKTVRLARFIMGVDNGTYVDHRDGDPLNNRRGNLRPSSKAGNARAFQRKRSGTVSRFRGVSFTGGKWRGKVVVSKVFLSEEEASSFYVTTREKLHALLPPENPRPSFTKLAGTKSRFTGVNRVLSGNWQGMVQISKAFETEVEAALFYNTSARLLYGDFAQLNVVATVEA